MEDQQQQPLAPQTNPATQQAPPQQRGSFNIQEFLSSQGLTASGVNPDGTVKVKSPGRPDEGVFDPKAFLKSQGVDPTSLDINVNSPNSAFAENAVGFSAAMKLAWAKNDADKLKILEEDFGQGNVQVADGKITVKEDGVWKTADPGFLKGIGAAMASKSPVMAAGIAGSVGGGKAGALAGSMIGTAVMPGLGTIAGAAIGGFAGTVLGGSLASTLANTAGNEVASKFGIRSESDLQEIQKEIGKEFAESVVWDAMLLGGGKILKTGAKAGSGIVKRSYHAFFDKEGIAETMSKVFMPGTQTGDWSTVLRSTEDAQQVLKYMDLTIKHKGDVAYDAAKSAVDPVMERMTRVASMAMRSFKSKASAQYSTAINTLEEAGVFAKTKVPVDGVLTKLEGALDDMGLIGQKNGQKIFLNKSQAANADQIMTLFDSKSRTALKEVWDSARGAAGRPEPLSFTDAKKLLDGIDDVLEKSGFFNGGEHAISSSARRALKSTRHELRNQLSSALDGKQVLLNGKLSNARVVFDEASLKYASFRQHYDDFALPQNLGGNKSQVMATMQRMLGEKGAALEESFGMLAKSVGDDGAKFINRLQQMRAGRNLAEQYSNRTGFSAFFAKTLGYGSPRTVATNIANSALPGLTRATPSASKIAAVQATAKATDFVRNLGPELRKDLLSSPELYRGLVESVMAVPQMSQATSEELLSPLRGPPQ